MGLCRLCMMSCNSQASRVKFFKLRSISKLNVTDSVKEAGRQFLSAI
jgi:hypothetical protein